MAAAPVRVLLLEDQDDDALLIERELTRSGVVCEVRRAVDRPSFVTALHEHRADLILSDNALLGGFTGSEARELAMEGAPATPFVFVSGTIGEEAAIEAMRQGATDYVIKDRLSRLGPVVQRALREAEGRRTRDRLEREFLQAQKMECLGRMAGSIAHDFNTLLTVILGNAGMLEEEEGEPGRVSVMAVAIRKAAERGKDLTSRLLEFSRGNMLEAREFDLNEQARAFGPMVDTLLSKRITFKATYHSAALPLRGSPGQIDQVIMNLLVNAGDAIAGEGAITLETGACGAPGAAPDGFAMLAAGRYASLTIRDTGQGMTAGTKARLFEPFFTTKSPGRGTGLGLATVYCIVRQFGGGIAVESEPGHGCEVRIVLPLVGTVIEHADLPALTAPAVLLVDDEDGIRGYVRHVLEASGRRVVEAGGGREAVALLERDPGAYGLVLTDVMMPGLDGVAVARRARELRPGIPVVFMSGLEVASAEAAAAVPGATRLAKPMLPSDLARVARLFPTG